MTLLPQKEETQNGTIMKDKELFSLYAELIQKYGKDTPNHISEFLNIIKETHQKNFKKENPTGDAEQSWRSVKGKNLEKLILHIIEKSITDIGLKVINGEKLSGIQKDIELDTVKRNVIIDYGTFGCHLPDADLIIYKPVTNRVIAIISSKVTLRERVAQTGYWNFKLKESFNTKHIQVLFVTLDEDGTLHTNKINKGRAITETDIDCTYVLTAAKFEASDKIKPFDKMINDIKRYTK